MVEEAFVVCFEIIGDIEHLTIGFVNYSDKYCLLVPLYFLDPILLLILFFLLWLCLLLLLLGQLLAKKPKALSFHIRS